MQENQQAIFKTQTTERDIYQRLSQARQFIDTSYHLPIDLHQIARQAFSRRIISCAYSGKLFTRRRMNI